MKILITKNTSSIVNVEQGNSYNHQEIGLAKALNRAGHQCDVVYYGGKKARTIKIGYNEKGEVFSLYYLRGIGFLKNVFYFGMGKIAKQYDIIHSIGYDNFQSWKFARCCPEKLVIYHGTYYSPFNVRYNQKTPYIDWLFLSAYKRNNIYFCTKSHLSEDFLRLKGLHNITSIGVGIDLGIIVNKADDTNEFVKELQNIKANGYKLLLYIGRIEPRRNIKYLIDIISNCYQKCKIKLVVIGKGNDPYKQECFEYIDSKHVREAILYREYLDQKYLKAIYQTCDVFLLPTYYDIYGMVLLEAMYFGKPVLTTLNGGSDMMIKDGENGFVLENNDVDKWLEKIYDLINDKKKSTLIGEKAHTTILESFTWDVLSKKFLEIYQMRLDKMSVSV